jgi:hypothetical protein
VQKANKNVSFRARSRLNGSDQVQCEVIIVVRKRSNLVSGWQRRERKRVFRKGYETSRHRDRTYGAVTVQDEVILEVLFV